jgi:replicative DNA helicase
MTCRGFIKNCIKISDFAFFDRVEKIEFVGEKETYDLSVEEPNHNFLVNGIVTHNSFWLTAVGKAGIQHHKKVLHITLELSEEKTARRYVQSIFSLTKAEAGQIRTTCFNKDELGNTTIDFKEFIRDSVVAKRKQIHQRLLKMMKYPKLLIKEFPPNSLTTEHLGLYLDGLERDGFKPDLLIIDYADLMKIDSESIRVDTGRLYRDLRGIAVSRKIALVTASQGNRESDDAKLVNRKNVAEDWSKIGTADMVLTYSQTPQEFKLGLARIFVAKSRDEGDQYLALISQSYAIAQFCLDSVPMTPSIVQQLEHE